MNVTLTWQAVITAAAAVSAILAIVAYFAKVVRWADRQKQQDAEIQSLKDEQTIIVYGLLACLKGLQEQGCDGPVKDAVNRLEKYLNCKAHQ